MEEIDVRIARRVGGTKGYGKRWEPTPEELMAARKLARTGATLQTICDALNSPISVRSLGTRLKAYGIIIRSPGPVRKHELVPYGISQRKADRPPSGDDAEFRNRLEMERTT